MMELATLLGEYGSEILADFQHHYHLNLYEVVETGPYERDDILDLIWRLPEESCFAKALGNPLNGWTLDRAMLMSVANELKVLNYNTLRVAQAKGVKKPKFWELPSLEQPVEVSEHSSEIEARMLAKWSEETDGEE